jgi:hypothetical protein
MLRVLARSLVFLAVQSVAGWSSSSAPAWLDRLPRSPDRYIGIGRADKAVHPIDYREAAQAAALAQISREISIRVRSESRSWVEEGPRGSDERFSQTVQGVSGTELTGYELVDQYETEDALWVYYALDKEAYLKSVEAAERKEAARWAREEAGLEEELGSRRIQAAVGRWNRLRRQVPVDAAESACPAHFERMTSRFREALGRTGLKLEPREWVLDVGDSQARGNGNQSGSVRVYLVDEADGSRWKGPLSLAVTRRGSPKEPACKVETGLDGGMNLADLLRACGLKPGTWEVEWKGPDGMRFQGEVKAKVLKAEWALSVRTKGGAGGASGPGAAGGIGFEEDLEVELASRESLFFRWADKGTPGPAVEIEVREARVDSLEGVYFTTLRGTARLPGAHSPLDVHGKAGHSNRAASRVRAIRDFAKNVMRSVEAP